MNKRYVLLFSFLLILIFQINFVQNAVINFFIGVRDTVESGIDKISSQIEAIKDSKQIIFSLKKENEKLKKELAGFYSFYRNCKDLNKLKLVKDSNLTLVKTVGYVSLPDFTKIYVNYPKKITHPLGLVYNNLAAGMVVKNEMKYSVALLNSNPKTSYTVFIGENEVPGIFYGKSNVIKYIPKFKSVKVGDLVITSGLDGIFYKGALVGKVTSVRENKLYQEANVTLFYDSLNPSYFYIVNKTDFPKKETNSTK
ncbi:MAG: hypothetical protein GXO01_05480 [Epsilonproteobacteria bacterium]|nr:hypothetical protein [Campylobacterota bacterium]